MSYKIHRRPLTIKAILQARSARCIGAGLPSFVSSSRKCVKASPAFFLPHSFSHELPNMPTLLTFTDYDANVYQISTSEFRQSPREDTASKTPSPSPISALWKPLTVHVTQPLDGERSLDAAYGTPSKWMKPPRVTADLNYWRPRLRRMC